MKANEKKKINEKNGSFVFLLFQTVVIFIPIYIIYVSLPSLLPLYREVGICISVVLFMVSVLAYYYGSKDTIGVVTIISVYNFTVIAAIFLIDHMSDLYALTGAHELEMILRQNMPIAKFIYFAVCFIQPILLPVPEAVTIVAGSSVLGALNAFVLGFIGTYFGIIAMFFISKVGGLKIARRLVKEESLEQYHKYVKKNEIIILVILFIVPILPDEIISAGAGLSGVSTKRFLIIACISKIVTSFALSYSVGLVYFFSFTTLEIILCILAALLVLGGITILIKKNYLK